MHTFEQIVPEAFTANVRGQDFEVQAIHDWPVQSIRKVMEYGLQRIFNDAAAGAEGDKDSDELRANSLTLAQKRLDNLKSGVLRASPNRESDPVKAEAVRIATAQVEAALKSKGHKLKDVGAAKIRELANGLIEKNPAITATAKSNVEASKGLVLDLSDIDLEEGE